MGHFIENQHTRLYADLARYLHTWAGKKVCFSVDLEVTLHLEKAICMYEYEQRTNEHIA